MQIEMIKTSELIPYERNPRKNDAAVDKVAAHQNAEVKRKMQADVQREAMKYYGWSVEDFIEIFGKSYI